MKAKLLKIFTVCLVITAILSPEIAVFGIVWQQHLLLEKTNLNINNTNYKITNAQNIETNIFLQSEQNHFLFVINKYKIIFILECLLICIPAGIGVSIFAYDKYLIYRAEIYRKQVEILEKMWQKSNYW